MNQQKTLFVVVPECLGLEEKRLVRLGLAKENLPKLHPCDGAGTAAAQWLTYCFGERGWVVYLEIDRSGDHTSNFSDKLEHRMRKVLSVKNSDPCYVWYIECRTLKSSSSDEADILVGDDTTNTQQCSSVRSRHANSLFYAELADTLRSSNTAAASVAIHPTEETEKDWRRARRWGLRHCLNLTFHSDLLQSSPRRLFEICKTIAVWADYTLWKIFQGYHGSANRPPIKSRRKHPKKWLASTSEETRARTATWNTDDRKTDKKTSSYQSYSLFINSKGDPFESKKQTKRVSFAYEKEDDEQPASGEYEKIRCRLKVLSGEDKLFKNSFIAAQPYADCARADTASSVSSVSSKELEFWVQPKNVHSRCMIRFLLFERKLDSKQTRAVYSEYAHCRIPLSLVFTKAVVSLPFEWVYGGGPDKPPVFQLSLDPSFVKYTKETSSRVTSPIESRMRMIMTDDTKQKAIREYQLQLRKTIELHLTEMSFFSEFPSGRQPRWSMLLHENQTSFGLMNDLIYFWVNERSEMNSNVSDAFADHLVRVTCLRLNLTLEEYIEWCNHHPGFAPFFLSQLITLVPGLMSYTSDQFEDNHSFPLSGELKTGQAAVDCEEIGSMCTFIVKYLRKATGAHLLDPIRELLQLYTAFTCHVTAQSDTGGRPSSIETDMLHAISGLIPTHMYKALRHQSDRPPNEKETMAWRSDTIRLPVMFFDAIADTQAVFYESPLPEAMQKRYQYHLSTPSAEMRLPPLLRRFYSSQFQLQQKIKHNLLTMYVVNDSSIEACEELIPITWHAPTQRWCWGIPVSLIWSGFTLLLKDSASSASSMMISIPREFALWSPIQPSTEFKQAAVEIASEMRHLNDIRFQPSLASRWLDNTKMDQLVLDDRKKTKDNKRMLRVVHLLYRQMDTRTSLQQRLRSDLLSTRTSTLIQTNIVSDSSEYIMDGLEDVSRVLVVSLK